LSAARAGSPVCLIEGTSHPGGTVTHVLIHTLGGFFDVRGELINGGLAAEVVRRLQLADPSVGLRRMGRLWVVQVAPPVYRRVVDEWVRADSRIEVMYRSRVTAVRREGPLVVEIQVSRDGVRHNIRPGALIDTTGCGGVIRLIDPDLVEDDQCRAAGGLVVTLTDVVPGSLAFPKGAGVIRLLREAVEKGRLPPECRHAWLDLGTSEDEVYLKLFVPLSPVERDPSIELMQRLGRMTRAIVELLHSVPGFEQARVQQIGALGIRDGGRIRGEYRLLVDDVRAGRTFEDAACHCCWPIEYWDPERGLLLEHLPEGTQYDIPLRALTLRGFENVWGAGKCLSADRLAHASARVVGACWGMGAAVGGAAAAAAIGAEHEPDACTLRNGRA
jgi:hypothetical protein